MGDLVDMIGKKFGKLKVLRRNGLYSNSGSVAYDCECDCGNIINVGGHRLRAKRIKQCKECRPDLCKERSNGWRGYGEISRCFYNRIKFNAKKRNWEMNISIEYIWNLFLQQEKKCAISGIDIFFGKSQVEEAHGKITASLDRIDPTKGYIEGNVQWVHKWVNIIKQDFTEEELLYWCETIYKNKKDNIC